MIDNHASNIKWKFRRPIWKNSTKTIKVSPLKIASPKSLDDLKEVVQQALIEEIPVRAVGSGHSFSEAPVADGILLLPDKLNKLKTTSYTDNKRLVEVEGGIRLRDLNKKLDNHKLCIPTMGGIDHQRIAGALSTGTHGSSMGFGTMAEMVRSIVLVSHKKDNPNQVWVFRIEKQSDPVTKKDNEVDEIIYDDDIFNSAVVCFGTMGIIYSYVLEVEPMYYLKEVKKVESWIELKRSIVDESLLDKHRSVFVQINPYRTKRRPNRSALLATHDLHDGLSDSSLKMQRIKRGFWHKIKRSTRSFSFELTSLFPQIIHVFIWVLNKFPNLIPWFLHQAVRSQKDEEYIERGHKVMYQGLDYVKERAYDCEIGIPMDSEGRYLDLVDELMNHLEKIRKDYNIHITSPLGLRFTKSSKILMAPEHGTNICYIDTPVLLAIYGRETILSRIQEFLLKHHARPHWGKLNFMVTKDYVMKEYPRSDRFIEIVNQFNRTGIFSNRFSKRMIGV